MVFMRMFRIFSVFSAYEEYLSLQVINTNFGINHRTTVLVENLDPTRTTFNSRSSKLSQFKSS